ncbi:SixA phosphatase family protein [Thalassovita aquimarina]|uniref:SixA phosphatase family protein n=1 Tax=Thalassovita aquimarina TaxID=2785917 RepID=UPI003564AF29
MTLRLILMRHAKSDWDDPSLTDHARPLNTRGRDAAKAMGDWLRDNGYLPDLVLSSDAARTVETCDRLGISADTRFLRALYHASPMDMMQVLRQGGNAKTLLMVGHNPGIAEFAASLAAKAPDDPDFDRYPTCATTVFDLPIAGWQDALFGDGQVRDFIVPRRLG